MRDSNQMGRVNMADTERGRGADTTGGTTRRRLLVAGASAAAVLAAGCSDVASQSFEATPVTLPSESQETLQLRETATESQTLNREGPAGETEVTITNHVAIYSRAEWLQDGGE